MRRLAIPLAFLIGTGCVPQDEADWQGVPADTVLDELQPDETVEPGARRNLVLTSPGIYHSDPLPLTITGLNPGETVHLLRGSSTSSGPCPSQIGGLCLDLGGSATYLGNRTADASGVAVFTVTIPGTLQGVNVALQAVASRGVGGASSVKTNVVSGAIQAPGGGMTADDLVPGDLVVTEIMQNPNASADSTGEWFEVYNNAGADVDLDGLVISDFGSDLHTVSGPVIVPAGGYAVLAKNGDSGVNGGVNADYVYSGVTLGNGDDELVLSNLSGTLDTAAWDGGAAWPDPVGASMQLSDALLDDLSNDNGAAWCDSLVPFGAGDAGSPGAANADCAAGPTQTCSDGVQNQNETGIDCGGVCPACNGGIPSYLTDEDFETGDLSVFPYTSTGTNEWTIESDAAACHGGSYCLRTNPGHALSETSTIEVALSVRQNDNVSFWVETNTEPGEHYFRFYIDGVLQLELSGQNPYTEYTFPVAATGANGPDRVFTWEYSRSAFMSQAHVPWNEVWVDDIDFPEWNSQPGVPVLSGPGNHVIVDASPTFDWLATDADFDNVTYEFQYDTDPGFPTPSTTGETYATSDQPQLADDVWYWRVRSKDDSDYRWSAWSETRSVEVDGAAEYPVAWQQRVAGQFDMNDLMGIDTSNDSMEAISTTFDQWSNWIYSSTGGTHTFYPSTLTTSTSATATVEAYGDFDSPTSEYVDLVSIDGDTLSTNWSPGTCGTTGSRTFSIADVSPYTTDGRIDVEVSFSSAVDASVCGTDASRVRLLWDGADALVTSDPIDHADLAGSLWDRVQWSATGDVTLQILDENLSLVPDADLPGNSAGFTGGTVHLFDVDPVVYPVLHLQATLGPAASLDDWRVVANDGFEWTFEYDGDDEGWEAIDDGVTPSLSVGGGMMYFESYTGGLDPHVELWFPQPVDATRFSTLEMRVRTSNNYINDDPTLFWASNFGAFDTRRSIVDPQVYLFTMQTITFDLTDVPPLPQEPWQGMVEAIRLDPVQAFEDQLGNPADGWFEIDWVRLY